MISRAVCTRPINGTYDSCLKLFLMNSLPVVLIVFPQQLHYNARNAIYHPFLFFLFWLLKVLEGIMMKIIYDNNGA